MRPMTKLNFSHYVLKQVISLGYNIKYKFLGQLIIYEQMENITSLKISRKTFMVNVGF